MRDELRSQTVSQKSEAKSAAGHQVEPVASAGEYLQGQVGCCPWHPRPSFFDFDGAILDPADIKVDAYLTIYADEDPETVKQFVQHAHLHGAQRGE